MNNIKRNILALYGREPYSLNDLAQCVIKVIDQVWPVVGFSWSIQKSQTVSNSHSSPIGGVQNWSRKPGKPIGYPGWVGRVWIRYQSRSNGGFGSAPFERTLTYPGTGGGGDYGGPWKAISAARWNNGKIRKDYPEPAIYSWDYCFYDSDWPNLYKLCLFDIIKNDQTQYSHLFRWEDPEIVKQDKEFLNHCKKLVDI